MIRRLTAALTVTMLAVPTFGLGTASAAPTCPTPGTEALCGFRIVAEAMNTTSFVQFDLELEPALLAIEALAPEVVDVKGLGDWIGQPDLRSVDGHQLWVARVTDESVPAADKVQVVASLSVHGTEPGGREGGIRYLEDLARLWADGESDHELFSGDSGFTLAEVLAKTETYFVWLNPDGWADGDLANPSSPIFNRGNGTGSDLNREFPTTGWTNLENTQLSEPESIGFTTFIDGLPSLATAADIHGELTSATGSFADMMWPAGEWTPKEQAQELQLAKNMTKTIERVFAEDTVVWTTVSEPIAGDQSGLQVATKPAQFATAYDIVGYDDSGFMGDFFVSRGAIEIDIENFLSHLAPGIAWFGPLEQAHIAAVRGIIETLMVEALITLDAELVIDIGNIAIVDDPAIVSSSDEDDFVNYAEAFDGSEPLEYDVTKMLYWDDLGGYIGRDLPMLSPVDIASGATDLTQFDSVVVTDNPFPADRAGRSYQDGAYLAALRAFAEQGGQVVLLDGAVTILDDLGLVAESELVYATSQAGHVVFGEITHPWEENLEGLPQQTYYAVPLGYRSSSSIQEAPHHGVTTSAWEEAGGTTVGTAEGSADAPFTNLGELPVGDGSVAMFGAILPTQTEENPHVYGLANYAVTVNGGIVLHDILSYRAANAAAPGPAPAPAPAPTPAPSPSPLPATGGGLALLGLLSLAGQRSLRRR